MHAITLHIGRALKALCFFLIPCYALSWRGSGWVVSAKRRGELQRVKPRAYDVSGFVVSGQPPSWSGRLRGATRDAADRFDSLFTTAGTLETT